MVVHRVFPAGIPFAIHLVRDTNILLDQITPTDYEHDAFKRG
jgi:hypothetical protein